MESIHKRHQSLFGKSYYRTHWISLEVLCVFFIIGSLIGLIFSESVNHFYKTTFSNVFMFYPTSARLEQQESYSWHGTFKESLGSLPQEDLHNAETQVTSFTWQGNSTIITIAPYKIIPEQTLELELVDHFGATLTPVCGEATDLPIHLTPYICKMRNYNGSQQ